MSRCAFLEGWDPELVPIHGTVASTAGETTSALSELMKH